MIVTYTLFWLRRLGIFKTAALFWVLNCFKQLKHQTTFYFNQRFDKSKAQPPLRSRIFERMF